MVKKKSTVATVFGILQIVFGSLGLLGPILYFAGAQQVMANWQAGMMKGPGQQELSQERLLAEVTRRLPWYHTFELGMNGACLVLCLMMIIGGIGLLQMQRWAHRLTIAYALLSICYTAVMTTLTIGWISPVMGEVVSDAMRAQIKAMPGGGPGPGGPDAEAMIGIMKAAMTVGAVCGAGVAIYPLIVLIFMLVPSVRAAFSGVALPEEPEDYDDRYREEDERRPDDRYPPDEPLEPDERFRPGGR